MPNTNLLPSERRALPAMIEIVTPYTVDSPIKTNVLLKELIDRGYKVSLRSPRRMAKVIRKDNGVMILSSSNPKLGGFFRAGSEADADAWLEESGNRAFNILADRTVVKKHFRQCRRRVPRVREVKLVELQRELGI